MDPAPTSLRVPTMHELQLFHWMKYGRAAPPAAVAFAASSDTSTTDKASSHSGDSAAEDRVVVAPGVSVPPLWAEYLQGLAMPADSADATNGTMPLLHVLPNGDNNDDNDDNWGEIKRRLLAHVDGQLAGAVMGSPPPAAAVAVGVTAGPLPAALRALEEAANGAAGSDVVTGVLPDVPLSAAFWGAEQPTEAEVEGDGRHVVPLPLSLSRAAALYAALAPSVVGVEGRGDVLDTNLRVSHECPLATALPAVRLPPPLDTFACPSAVETLRQRLCPEAAALTVVPYKFVMYRQGDFFAPHVDATHQDPLMLGSLAVQVPIVDDSWRLGAPAEAAKEAPAPADNRRNYFRGDDASCPASGELVFYPGRHASDVRDDASEDYNCPESSAEQLRIRVDLTTVEQPTQCQEGQGPVGWCQPLRYAAWLGDVLHEVRRVETRFRAVVIYRLFKVFSPAPPQHEEASASSGIPQTIQQRFPPPPTTPFATYFAAMCQAPVLPQHLRHPLAQLYRNGAVSPAMSTLEQRLHDVMRQLPSPSARSAAGGPVGATHLGVLLRHPYPPGGLVPAALKGGDALLYAVASHHYDVRLTPCTEWREDDMGGAYRLGSAPRQGISTSGPTPPFTKCVFPVPEDTFARDFDLEESDAIERVVQRGYVPLQHTLWVQLGFGKMIGGGACYGNCDCGTDWWYRASALIISPRPCPWRSRLPLFLVATRGPPTLRTLMQHPDVFMLITSYL